MRIAYLCLDRGIPVAGGKGASVHVRSITTALAARGHHVILVCAKLGQGNALPVVSRIVELGTDSDGPERQLEEVLAPDTVDVVIERYSLESGPASTLCRRMNIPLLLEVNAPIVLEAARYRGLHAVDAALENERRVFESAHTITAVSEALVSYAKGRAPTTPAVCNPNGVDVDAFAHARPIRAPNDSTHLVVGFVGSMKRWHGVDDLLEAFTALTTRHRALRLVLAGTGPEEAPLREQVTRLHLTDRVFLPGAVPHHEIPGVVAGFDIAVAPYRPSVDFYFCPLKVLEYLGAGIPIVFPMLGDLPGIVGGAGLGYRPGSVEGLTEAISTLVDDTALRCELATAARDRRRRYTWRQTAERTEELLTSAVAGLSLAAP